MSSKITDKVAEWKVANPGQAFFSFEYFPPKTDEGVQNLISRVDKMADLKPMWVDYTWGAGGATSDLTPFLCEKAMDSGLDVLMHLTCTNVTIETTRKVLELCKEKGLRNILALRGDPPANTENWTATEGGFSHAVDLVRFIRQEFGDYFCIGVAAYPEGHMDNEDKEADFQFFKEKVEAGADFGVTQLFYDCTFYFEFMKKCRANGLGLDIFPGIMPIQNYGGFKRMIGFCNTYVPPAVEAALAPIETDDAAVKAYGIELGVQMSRELLAGGAPGVHIYTLNLETTAVAIVRELGLVDESKATKENPWRKSTAAKRAQEDVRPIFWAQRGRSYLQRTQCWDEFPNGRWGNRESPAFGLFDLPPKPSQKQIQTRKESWAFETPRDLNEVFVRFLEGEVKSLPWCTSNPGVETVGIKKQLQRLCSSGFLTINSQPRVNGALATDPLFGWGPAGGVVYQKAYAEFFCSPRLFDTLIKGIQSHRTIQYAAVQRNGDMKTNMADSSAVAAVTWGVFPGQEIQQPTVVDLGSFVAWKEEAFALWQDWVDVTPAEKTACHELLQQIQEEWYLVMVVDNDFLVGDLFANLTDVCRREYLDALRTGA